MNITFNDAIYNYLNYIKIKSKNSSYRCIKNRIINHILPYVKEYNIYDFKAKDYLQWQININKLNYKFKYKSTLHTCFVTLLNFCITFYDLNTNVASKVGNFKNNDIENNGMIWTIEEFKKFINVISDTVHKVFFKFLFFTGCRLGEALALTFNDIDFDKKTLTINKTATRFFENNKRVLNNPKSKSSIRTISINTNLITELLRLKQYYKKIYKNFNNNYFVFGGLDPIPFTTITRYKNIYCELANVKQIKIHEFRHSHACLLFQNNVPIDEISYRLGHSKISMTMDIYLKYLPKKEKRVLETLNSINI